MRKPYIAPEACLELFAPVERLMSSWQKRDNFTSRWWIENNFFWGQKANESATPGEWYIELDSTEEFKKD